MDDHPVASNPNDMWDYHKRATECYEGIHKVCEKNSPEGRCKVLISLQQLKKLEAGNAFFMQVNTHLNYQLDWFHQKEKSLESTLARIKAEVEQVLVGDNAISIDYQGFQQGIQESQREITESSVHDEIDFLLRNLLQTIIRLKEKVRRQAELLEQTNHEASASVIHSKKLIADLIRRLNNIQAHKETLYDDQCLAEWRNLRHALDVWTRWNFKDTAALNEMTPQELRENNLPTVPSEEVLKTIYAKRAYIQSVIVGVVFKEVFEPTFARSPNKTISRHFRELSEGMKVNGDSQAWEHWRLATSEGLKHFPPHRLNASCDKLVIKVEFFLSKYCGPDIQMDAALEALREGFRACISFKDKLERQELEYTFRRSKKRTAYISEQMNSLNSEDYDGSTVQIRLWPSIYKVSFNNEELLLEPEAVWTGSAGYMSDMDMEDQSETKKEPDEVGEHEP